MLLVTAKIGKHIIMITQGFDFVAVIFVVSGAIVWLESRYRSDFFRWFPSIVLVMFAAMTLYTIGLWQFTEEVRQARESLRDNLIPAMLFLMSLRFNLAIIRKLGIRLVALSLASTFSIMLGFIFTQQLMQGFLGAETPLTFAAMSAGWTGGTQNFVAVKEALSVTDEAMTYTLLMGAVCYSIWLVVILALKPLKSRFDRFLRSNDHGLDHVVESLQAVENKKRIEMPSLFFMLGLSLAVASFSNYLGGIIAIAGFQSPMVWVIIVSTTLGMLGASTPLGNLGGSEEVSTIMLYVIVALIGAEVSLGAIWQAPMYIFSGFVILSIHGVLLLIAARFLRMNLLLTGIASIANIGSAPSAAVVGASYGRGLVPIAIIMALIGSMIGSFAGLAVSEVLLWLSELE